MVLRNELVNPHALSDTLTCPICMDILQAPVFYGGHPCQHVFCRKCIKEALKQQRQCPVCRAIIGSQEPQPHQALSSLIDEVCVRCEHACGWTGRYDARPHHAQICPVVLLKQAQEDNMELRNTVCNLERQIASHVEGIAKRDYMIRKLTKVVNNMIGKCMNNAGRLSTHNTDWPKDIQRKAERDLHEYLPMGHLLMSQ